MVVNADIWTDYDFNRLPAGPAGLAHLVLVSNPEHHPRGDFVLENGKVAITDGPRFTFSGIGVYKPELFADCSEQVFSLAPVLRAAACRGAVSGEIYHGRWLDVGTPARLEYLQTLLKQC